MNFAKSGRFYHQYRLREGSKPGLPHQRVNHGYSGWITEDIPIDGITERLILLEAYAQSIIKDLTCYDQTRRRKMKYAATLSYKELDQEKLLLKLDLFHLHFIYEKHEQYHDDAGIQRCVCRYG